MTDRADTIAANIEAFIRAEVIPYEKDPRTGPHGPSDELVQEMRAKARKAGVLTPHILPDGSHLTQRETAKVLIKSGLSPLGPLACNTMAPDEGNMYLLGKVGSAEQKARFLEPLVSGQARSAFFMTEPADEGGAGSDPSMMQTTCRLDGNHWVINGRKKFITGAEGAQGRHRHGEVGRRRLHVPGRSARSRDPHRCACSIRSTVRCPADMPRSRSTTFASPPTRCSARPATVSNMRRSASARRACRTACAGSGLAIRANEIATDYACRRHAFGKPLVDHEGVGFMLAENLIDLKQSELMIDWCAGVLDTGSLGTAESSMAKVAVSEALMRVADRCVQVMGGTGVSAETIVEQVFREIRAFRIYDGPTEVHKWSLAKKIKRDWKAEQH